MSGAIFILDDLVFRFKSLVLIWKKSSNVVMDGFNSSISSELTSIRDGAVLLSPLARRVQCSRPRFIISKKTPCIYGVFVLNTVWLSGQTPDVTNGKTQPRRYLFLQSMWQHNLTTDELVISHIILLCCVESFNLTLLTTKHCGASVCGVFFYLTSRQRLLDCLMGRSGPPPSPSTPRLHSPCHAT